MNHELRDGLTKPFGPEAIRRKRGQGGREMEYVSHGMVTKRLNEVAPDWHAEMIERYVVEVNGQLHCLGGVMRLTIGEVTREEAGGPARLTTLADDLKNTYSDCLKRCAMRFGVALDLWESADENDEDAQPNTKAPTGAAAGPPERSAPPPRRMTSGSPAASPFPAPASPPATGARGTHAAAPPTSGGEEHYATIEDACGAMSAAASLADLTHVYNVAKHQFPNDYDTLVSEYKRLARQHQGLAPQETRA